MNRVLFSLFFLTVCCCSVTLSSAVDHSRRVVRAADKPTGNYTSAVVFVDLPSFSDIINITDLNVSTDKFNIRYMNIKFSKLSSAYALGYRIDLDAKTVQILLSLSKADIVGLYSASRPSSPFSSAEEFELNLNGHLIYSHRIPFSVSSEKVFFGVTEDRQLFHDKVKGNYRNAPANLVGQLTDYLDPTLLKAVVAKIEAEVDLKVNISDEGLGAVIKSEIAYKSRRELAARFKKAVVDAFTVAHLNSFSVVHNDVTKFTRVFQNFEVTLPTFTLREVQGMNLDRFETSFIGDVDVLGKAKLVIQSPLAVFKVVYRELNKAGAEKKTFFAEFELLGATYELGMIAKLKSSVVEFGSLDISVEAIQPSGAQGLYRDERDVIVQHLRGQLLSYFLENSNSSFSRYCKGILAEGQITSAVFK